MLLKNRTTHHFKFRIKPSKQLLQYLNNYHNSTEVNELSIIIDTFSIEWNISPIITIQLNGIKEILRIMKRSRCHIKDVVVTSHNKLRFKRRGLVMNGECKSIQINKQNNRYFVRLEINLEDCTKYNNILPNNIKILAIDLGVKNLASYAIINNHITEETGIIDSKREGADAITDLKQMIADLRYNINKSQRTHINKKLLQPQAERIKTAIHNIQQNNYFTGIPNGLWLIYAATIRDARNALIKLHVAGRKQERYEGILFNGLLTHYNNFTTNLLNKLVTIIVNLAIKKHINVVVMEDLSSYCDEARSLLSTLWSHRKIADSIQHSLTTNGITAAFVDPHHTSQIDPMTGEFAYRSKQNCSNLIVDRDGEILTLDADQAAAQNIGLRYLNQHTGLHHLKALIINDLLLPVSTTYTIIDAQLQNAIAAATGHLFGKLIKCDNDMYKLIGISSDEYFALYAQGTSTFVDLFKHKGLYVHKNLHKQLQEDIARKAGVFDSDCAYLAKKSFKKH